MFNLQRFVQEFKDSDCKKDISNLTYEHNSLFILFQKPFKGGEINNFRNFYTEVFLIFIRIINFQNYSNRIPLN